MTLADQIAECCERYKGDLLISVALTDEQWQQIIAALRRSEPTMQIQGLSYRAPERQPSSDKVLVPREPTDGMLKAMADCYDATWGYAQDSGVELGWAHKSYNAALSAAEAELRQEPHQKSDDSTSKG